MSNRHNPNRFLLYTIEKAKWVYDFLTMRQIRKFWNQSPGFRIIFKLAKDLLCPLTEFLCCRWLVTENIFESLKKLKTSRGFDSIYLVT